LELGAASTMVAVESVHAVAGGRVRVWVKP
jgi:hypothetical protein